MLADKEQLAPQERRRRLENGTRGSRANNLPAQPTPLIGREREVAAACAALQSGDVRLLTLTGPGGTGKTCLGLKVAAKLGDHFEHGVAFVALAPIRDPALVAATIAGALGITESAPGAVPKGYPARHPRPLLDSLKDYLRQKQLLLLVDNFEHVVAAAPLIAELLASAPQLKVLVTSRAALHVRGEQEFSVPPLALPDPKRLPPAGTDLVSAVSQSAAVDLFMRRAVAVKPDFAITIANARAVAELCIRLDGLPLAIELAAARIKLLTPQALLAHLGRSEETPSSHALALLTGGVRDLPARQQTLRSTIDWSYALLPAGEQTLFARLSVFVGGWTLEAAEAICSVDQGQRGDLPLAILDGLSSLLDENLLQRVDGSDGEPRFSMLETIREYALECLQARGEAEALRWRHARFFLELAEAAEPRLMTAEQATWLARLDAEHDNLRAVLAWSQAGDAGSPQACVGLRLVGALWRFWFLRGHFEEWDRWLAGALARSAGAPDALRAKALLGRGMLALAQWDEARAKTLGEESLALYRAARDRWGIAASLAIVGTIDLFRGEQAQACALLEESLALARDVGDPWLIAFALDSIAAVRRSQSEQAQAMALYKEALALRRRSGDRWGIATSLQYLSAMAMDGGDYGRARALLEEGLALRRELGDRLGMAHSFHGLATVEVLQGNYAAAYVLDAERLVIEQELGSKLGIAASVETLELIAGFQGDYVRATVLGEESLALQRELGDICHIAGALMSLGGVALLQGNYARAAALLEEGLALYRDLENKPGIAFALDNLGYVALWQGDCARATSLWEESLALYREMGEKRGIAWSLTALASSALHQGQYARAIALYEESLALFQELGNKLGISVCLTGFGGVAGARGQPEHAARLFGAAEALREATGAWLAPIERVEYDRNVAAARAQCDAAAFAAAWAAGRTLLPEQVLAALNLPAAPLEPASAPPEIPLTPPPPAPAANYPAGLTAREVEVLRLVAQGLTTADVAGQLILSPFTVNAHLRAIFKKLGVTSRTAAARFAVDHHIV